MAFRGDSGVLGDKQLYVLVLLVGDNGGVDSPCTEDDVSISLSSMVSRIGRRNGTCGVLSYGIYRSMAKVSESQPHKRLIKKGEDRNGGWMCVCCGVIAVGLV